MGWKGEMGVGDWVGELEFTVERKAICISNASGLSKKITPNDKRFDNL